jgi:hypothetical protein
MRQVRAFRRLPRAHNALAPDTPPPRSAQFQHRFAKPLKRRLRSFNESNNGSFIAGVSHLMRRRRKKCIWNFSNMECSTLPYFVKYGMFHILPYFTKYGSVSLIPKYGKIWNRPVNCTILL